MPNNHNDIGAELADICEAAAALILPLWRSGLAVSHKADESPVTEADQKGEALILKHLAERFPDIPVISEEDASEFGTPDAIGPRFFLVDPLDGTKAFVMGDPHFTVNSGLIENGRPVAGAVSDWFSSGSSSTVGVDVDVTESAAAGAPAGAVAGGAAPPVRARTWPPGEALCLISHTMKPETADKLAAEHGFDLREPMDSSIKLCRIAEGVADIYPRHGPTMEWDTAAGHAVLEAAGGRFTTTDGEVFLYGKAGEGFRNGWFVARGA